MTGLTRRDFLAGAATAAGALAVGGRAAAAPATFDGTLRVLGLMSARPRTTCPIRFSSRRSRISGSRSSAPRSFLRTSIACSPGARDVRRLLLLRAGLRRVLGDRQSAAGGGRPAAALERRHPALQAREGCSGQCPLQVRPGRRRISQALRRSGSLRPLAERAGRAAGSGSSSFSGSTSRPANGSGLSRSSSQALPARTTSTPSATTPRSSGSGPSSCRGRSSSTRAGDGASLSTASIRKAAFRTWRMPSRQRA